MTISLRNKFLFSSALLSLVLAGCGNGDTNDNDTGDDVNDDTVTETEEDETTEDSSELSGDITFWTASLSGDPFDGYFEQIKSDFEDMHPDVSVNIQDTPQNEMEQRVLTSLTGSDAMDVVNLNPHYMANIASQGGLLNMEEYLDDDISSRFVEGAFEAGFYDDELFALPWYLTTTVSWYNGDHFDAAGIEDFPSNMQEVHEASRAITEETGNPSFFQIINDGNTIMEKMVTIADGENIVENGEAVFQDNEEILEFFETIQDMYAEGLISQQNAEGSIGAAQELFMNENLSLVEGGITFLGPIESGAPSVYEASRAGQPLNGEDAPMNIAVMNLAVPANTENPEAAVAFAEFVLNAENQLEFAELAGTVLPSTVESLEDDYFTDPGDSPKATGMQQGAQALERARVLIPLTDNNFELREMTQNKFVEVMIGDISAEEGVNQLADDWTQSFSNSDIDVSF
ncbi:MAG: extracellular solute-binding protein [Alkalibacterium sp.]|nr:extracellular solute-binding protein [Alkalibacterium sp.]